MFRSAQVCGPNGPAERFQLDGDRVVLEMDGSGNTIAANVYGTNFSETDGCGKMTTFALSLIHISQGIVR